MASTFETSLPVRQMSDQPKVKLGGLDTKQEELKTEEEELDTDQEESDTKQEELDTKQDESDAKQKSDPRDGPGPGSNSSAEAQKCHMCQQHGAECSKGPPCTRCMENHFNCSSDPELRPMNIMEAKLNPTEDEVRRTIMQMKRLRKALHDMSNDHQTILQNLTDQKENCRVLRRMWQTKDNQVTAMNTQIWELKIQKQKMEQMHRTELAALNKHLGMLTSKQVMLLNMIDSLIAGSSLNMSLMSEMLRAETERGPSGNTFQVARHNTGLRLNNAGAVPAWSGSAGVVPRVAPAGPQEAANGLNNGERHTEIAQWRGAPGF